MEDMTETTMFDTWGEAIEWIDQCKCGERELDYIAEMAQHCYCGCGHRRVLWCKFKSCGCTNHGIMGKEGF